VVGGSGSRSSGRGSVADILRRGNWAGRGGIGTRARLRRPATPSPRRTTPRPPRSASSSRLGARDRARLTASRATAVRAVRRRRSAESTWAAAATGLATGSPTGAGGGVASGRRRGVDVRALRARLSALTRVRADAAACEPETAAAASGRARTRARPPVARRVRPADRRARTAGCAAGAGGAAEAAAGAGCSAGRG
jgi:hypothetical protein